MKIHIRQQWLLLAAICAAGVVFANTVRIRIGP